MHEFTFSYLLSYLKAKRRQLILFTLGGGVAGFFYLLNAPHIYEVVSYWKLPQSNKISSEGNLQKSLVVTVPSSFDARRILLNPAAITSSMLASCGLVDSNQNRKLLVNAVSMVDADADGKTMLIRVRLEGRDDAKKCASALANEMVAYSNQVKNHYVAHYQAKGFQGMLNEDAFVLPTILVSDAPIFPRKNLILIAGLLIGFLLSIFMDWIVYLFRRKT